MNGTSRAERRAATRAVYRSSASGSSTHGSNAPGRAAADVEPITVVNSGHSAYAAAASSRDAPLPTRSRSARRRAPQNATDTISDSHSRSASHTGSRTRSPSQ